jgi:hypothetical protein
MLPVIEGYLSVPIGVASPVYVDHHSLFVFAPGWDPNVKIETVFIKSCLGIITGESCDPLSCQICQRDIEVVNIVVPGRERGY